MFKEEAEELRVPTNLAQQGINVYGRGNSFTASFDEGMRSMALAVTQAPAVGNWYYGKKDKENGLEPITRDYFDSINNQYGLGMEYIKGETPSQFSLRTELAITNQIRRARVNQQYGATNMVGSMIPELANPVNLVPFGRVMTAGRLVNKAAIASARGKKLTSAFETYKDYAREAFIGNAAVEPLYYMSAKQQGDDYNIEDSFLNIAVGSAVGTGFFGSIGAGMRYRKSNTYLRQAQMYENMYNFMETGQYRDAVNVALTKDPKFEQYLKGYSNLKDVVKTQIKEYGTIKFDKLTTKELKTLEKATRRYYDDLFDSALQKTLSDRIVEDLEGEGKNAKISDFAFKYRRMYANIATAHKRGVTDTLTPEEADLYRTLDKNYEGQTVYEQEEIGSGDYKLEPSKFVANEKAVKSAKIISETLYESKSKSLNEAVGKGFLTREEANTVLRVFNDNYMATYGQEVELANRLVNEIFGVNFKINKSVFSGNAMGQFNAKFPDEINVNRAEVFAYGQEGGVSIFNTIFHEAMHALEAHDEASWNKIYGIVSEHPKLKAELEKRARNLGYDTDAKVRAELPSHILEWAITQEEFWQELLQKDVPLYEKVRQLIVEIFKKLKYGKKSYGKIAERMDELLSKGTPEDLAREIAKALNEVRELRKFDSDAKEVADMIEQNVRYATNPEQPIITKKSYQSSKLEQDFKNVSSTQLGSNVLVDALDNLLYYTTAYSGDAQSMFDSILEFNEDFGAWVENIKQNLEDDTYLPNSVYETLYDVTREYRDNTRESRIKDFAYVELYDIEGVDLDLGRTVKIALANAPENSRYNEVVLSTLQNEYYKKVYRSLYDVMVEKTLRRDLEGLKVDGKIATLRSLIDGQERKGVKTKRSLEIDMISRSEDDANVILEVLDDYGLWDLFFGDTNTEWIKAYRGNPAKQAELSQFGANVKEASTKFHEELMDALRQDRLPDDWRGVDGLEKLFETIQKLQNYQLNELNRVGAFTNKKSGFAGVSQRWSPEVVASMSKAEFVADMLGRIDAEETNYLHQGTMRTKGGDLVPFEIKAYLESWYDELISGKQPDSVEQKIDQAKSRLVHIKPEAEADTVLKYSGYDNIGKLMIEQVMQKARTVVMAEYGGTEPKAMFDKVGTFKRLTGKQKLNYKSYKATVDYLLGDLETPADVDLGTFFKGVRQFSNLVFISGSGISSITDIPLAASTLKYQGINLGENNKMFLEAWAEAVERRFIGDKSGVANYFRAQGAGWDVILNSVARRLTAESSDKRTVLDKASTMLFKLNGLNALTTAHQEMYIDLFTRGLAEEIKLWKEGGQMDEILKQNLIEAGIEESDFGVLFNSITKTGDDVDRIGPTSVDDAKVSASLRSYIKKYMRQAVIMPDVGTNAQATLGFQKGTIIGEMARVATQYQPFMLAMSKLLYRRFANGNFGKNNVNRHKMAHFMGYLGSALAMAYVATVIKDLIRGKSPINLLEMTSFDMSRIVQQSGVLGVAEVALDAMDYGPMEATSPLMSTVFGLATNVATGDTKGAVSDVSDLTGGNIIGPGVWLHGLLGEIFGETLNEIQTSELDYIDKY